MNLGELSTRVAQITHRSDLAPQATNFADDATKKINRRLGLELEPLVDPTDTNEILTNYPLLYLYAALVSAFEYIHEGDAARMYNDRWLEEIDYQYITAPGTTEPIYMKGA